MGAEERLELADHPDDETGFMTLSRIIIFSVV
jgi:hypothetical protein